MSNAFYAPGPQRAAKVGDLFAAVARRYDFINDLQSFGLHRRWKRLAAQLASVRPGDRALDVCCGTGDLAFALAASGADVVGLDFSEAMLAVAKAKVQNQQSRAIAKSNFLKGSDTLPGVVANQQVGPTVSEISFGNQANVHRPPSTVPNPQFLHGDALRVPFPDASFEIVTVGYGLRNLVSWEAGLSEMTRVAKPGGRLVVLDFGKPDCVFLRTVYFTYLKLVVPLLGLIFCHNAGAYAYILESLKRYPAQRAVEAKMRELGLTNVRVVNLLGGAMSINLGQKTE